MNIVPIQAPEKVVDWIGLYVKSHREVRNYYYAFPKGTIFKITGTGPRKTLKSLPCKCCGMSGLIAIKDTKREFLMDFSFVELESET